MKYLHIENSHATFYLLWRSSLQIEFFEDDLHSLAWQCPEVVGALANVALLIEKYGRGKASILGLGVCG